LGTETSEITIDQYYIYRIACHEGSYNHYLKLFRNTYVHNDGNRFIVDARDSFVI
jgi:hypothetical protein